MTAQRTALRRHLSSCGLVVGLIHTFLPNLSPVHAEAQEAGTSAAPADHPRCSGAFLAAATYGDLEQLDFCLVYGGEPPSCTDKDGRTPLHLAAKAAQLDAALRLLAVGALMDRDVWGRSPLHYSVDMGLGPMTALLLDSGAYIELPDHARRTPLHYAARRGHFEVATLLLDRGAMLDPLDLDDRAPLHYSVRGDEYFNVTRLFVLRGAEIERPDIIGFRPLHFACFENQMQTVRYLCGSGADLYAMDLAGWNPLVHAAANGHKDLTKWLVVDTLRPKTYPLPNPDDFVKSDLEATILGLPAWMFALAVVAFAWFLVLVPAFCIVRRFVRLRRGYICDEDDEEWEQFLAGVFKSLEEEGSKQKHICDTWDAVPAHNLQDLHRVSGAG